MEDDKACTLSLSLEMGLSGGHVPKKDHKQKVHIKSFELYPKEEAIDVNHYDDGDDEAKGFNLKRIIEEEEEEEDQKDPNSMSYDNNKNCSRKKLRLTKEQSALLEDSFNLHVTLSPAQKHELADKLNLRHRQVEVWFQNRRARTKLKERVMECEFFKKCCEKLTNENLMLKKELEELRALKVNMSKIATLTTCSSCKELLKPNEGNNGQKKLQSSIEIESIRT